MNFCVLMGSPRLNGLTSELCMPFVAELKSNGAAVRYTELATKRIAPCKGCYACQNVSSGYGCVQRDDMYPLVDDILWSDCIVLATPIYSWYCTGEMKAVLDRHYGMNKFYGSASGSLWEGKSMALLLTHGYEREYATEPFVTGIERLCIHSKLRYRGMFSVRDVHGLESVRSNEAISGAKTFARRLLEP